MLDDDMELGKRGVQSQGSKHINAFSVWLDKHTLPEDKHKVADALATFASVLLGSHQGLGQAIQDAYEADPEGFMLILAYLLEYPGFEDLILALLSEILGTPITSLTDSEIDTIINSITDLTLRRILSIAMKAHGASSWTFGTIQFSLGVISAIRRRIRNGGRGERPTTPLQSSLVHDFSDAKLSELLGILDEINNEPWYDTTRWDVWYRAEGFFGRLNIDNYRDDIQTYYRKVLDASDASAGDIRRRFESAQQMDRSYRRDISSINAEVQRARRSIDDFTYGN